MAKVVGVKRPIKTKKVAVTNKGETVREIEIPISDNREIQDGVSPRGKLGSKAVEGKAIVGLSKGVTLNMGDFQSARIDVFIQRTVTDDEQVLRDTLLEIDEVLQDEIERQSSLLEE